MTGPVSRIGLAFLFVGLLAAPAGVEFVHHAPTLDPKLNHTMEQVASLGAAVSVVDFDHDGWQNI